MAKQIPGLKIGLVGCRFSARFHLEGWNRVYGVSCEVVGVASKSAASREEFAKQHGIKTFDSVEALAGEVDVLDICAPPYVHEPVIIEAAKAGKNVVVEKPYTGAFGSGGNDFTGFEAPKQPMMDEAMVSCARIRATVAESGIKLAYAENWVYAPPIQKEREILEKSGGRILMLRGEEAHNGSHSVAYGDWSLAGGGSLIGKGVHPLTAALYLKRCEGIASGAGPIRPKTASARTHRLTELPTFRDQGFFRPSYKDVEDYVSIHIVFEDGTIADIWSSELIMGGINNWLEVMADNHRTRCAINPTNTMQTYNPVEEQLDDVYVVEKIGTKQGWTNPAPDEDWITGFPQEFQDFAEAFTSDREPESGMDLGEDTVATVYAGYVSAENGGAEVEVPRLEM